MSTADLVAYQYTNLSGIETIQAIAFKAMVIGFLLSVCFQLYALLTRGACDLATPVLKILLAGAIIQSIPFIGGVFGDLADALAKAIGGSATNTLFAEVVGQQSWETMKIKAWVLERIFALTFATTLYPLMFGIKMMMIDTLFPIFFSLVLFTGLFLAPLSTFPGGGQLLGGWFKNLLEIALWPVVFAVLVSLCTASFKGLLEAMRTVDLGTYIDEVANLISSGLDSEAYELHADSVLYQLYQFWALCCAYVALTLFTPLIARMCVRSSSVGIIGGIAAAKTLGLAKSGMMALGSQMGLGRFVSMGGAAGAEAFGGGGHSGMGNVVNMIGGNQEGSLNDRNNEPSQKLTGRGA